MLLPVKFKLKPSEEQALKAQSWRPMVRGLLNFCLRDRIDSYTQILALHKCGMNFMIKAT